MKIIIFCILLINLRRIVKDNYKRKFFNEKFKMDKNDVFRYEVINVGQGLFSYFTSEKNPNTIFIYDAGSSNSKWITNFNQKIKDLQTNVFCKEGLKIKVFFSHPHLDHINLIKKVFQKRCINKISSIAFIINTIYYNNLVNYKVFNIAGYKFDDILSFKDKYSETRDPKDEKYLKKLGLFKIEDFKEDNYEIKFGIAKFKLLFDTVKMEDYNLKTDKNDSSLIMKFYVGKKDNGILLTGDATEFTYEHLFSVSKIYLKSKIYQVSHHGSNSEKSNNIDFLNKVKENDSIAVLSSPPFPNVLWKNDKGNTESLGGYSHPFGKLVTNLYSLFKTTCITGNQGDLHFIITKDEILNKNVCKKVEFTCKIFKSKFCYLRGNFEKKIRWSYKI